MGQSRVREISQRWAERQIRPGADPFVIEAAIKDFASEVTKQLDAQGMYEAMDVVLAMLEESPTLIGKRHG